MAAGGASTDTAEDVQLCCSLPAWGSSSHWVALDFRAVCIVPAVLFLCVTLQEAFRLPGNVCTVGIQSDPVPGTPKVCGWVQIRPVTVVPGPPLCW